MKFIRTPLILALVLLALGGIATWDEWKTEKEQQEKEAESKLTDLEIAQIRKVTLFSRNKKADKDDEDSAKPVQIEMQQVDGTWRVIAPLEAAADRSEVEDFIRTALEYKYEEIISEQSTELEKFGLHEPQRVITLVAEDGRSYVLKLGNNAPVGYSTYFQIEGTSKRQEVSTSEGASKRQEVSTSEGASKRQKVSTSGASGQDRIYLGSQYVTNSTKKSLFDFRDKRLITLDVEKVKGITFWHREVHAYEVKRQDGEFQLVRPEPFKTAQQKVKEYIEAFDQVRAEKFIDAPDAELVKKFKTANKIVMSAVFELSSGETQELTFVRDRGELLASFAPDKIVFGLPAAFEEKVRELSDNFRDHSIFSFDVASVSEIDIDGKVYRRVDNSWYLLSDLDAEGKIPSDKDGELAANASVDLLLDSLATAEALEFVERTKVAEELAKPAARRIIMQIEGDEQEKQQAVESTLEISFHAHPDDKERYYVTHTASEQVYVAARSLLEVYTVSTEQSKESALSDSVTTPPGG